MSPVKDHPGTHLRSIRVGVDPCCGASHTIRSHEHKEYPEGLVLGVGRVVTDLGEGPRKSIGNCQEVGEFNNYLNFSLVGRKKAGLELSLKKKQ